MASSSSCSGRDREIPVGPRTADVDTCQALIVCILARRICKRRFRVRAVRDWTPANRPRRDSARELRSLSMLISVSLGVPEYGDSSLTQLGMLRPWSQPDFVGV